MTDGEIIKGVQVIKYTCGAGTPEEAETNCTYFIRGECTASFCEYRRKKQTNADRIRAMSDEILAQEMIFFCPTDTVFKGTETYEKPHYTGLDGSYYSTAEELAAANLEWLQQPVE